MALKISNTLTGQMEEFRPLEDNLVRMYTCGPTVYGYAHIGNFRTFIFEDVLKRYLRFKGYRIKHVMNITDVDDKTIRDSKASEPSQLRKYTDQYTTAFMEDCRQLRIEEPDLVVHATDHIPEMVSLIERLTAKGHTYEKDGSIYFRIASFKDYGKLSKLDKEGIKPGARVDVDEYEKQDARDFVLWKAPKPEEPFWTTSIGSGRPGWHIECSAMSMKYLGDSFDLHCGGVDNIFPHHENEIAQSESVTGKPFVRYWMHGEHLIVEGEKMSKSKGNYYTLRDLLQKGIDPLDVRYVLLSIPYKHKLNFTFDALRQARSSLRRLQDFQIRLKTDHFPHEATAELHPLLKQAREQFEQAMDDDLNTAQALAVLFDLVREINIAMDQKGVSEEDHAAIHKAVAEINEVFDILAEPESEMDSRIRELIEQRNAARRARNFPLADQFRSQIYEMGYIIEDTREGTRWKKR
ncbi:MAG TPA: cysteine--tRNA ligase [Terriglobia bacterium]|nr:cysteine--tRNA ligase [Terriglobia bacterium]